MSGPNKQTSSPGTAATSLGQSIAPMVATASEIAELAEIPGLCHGRVGALKFYLILSKDT